MSRKEIIESLAGEYARGRRLSLWSNIPLEVLSRCRQDPTPHTQAVLDWEFLSALPEHQAQLRSNLNREPRTAGQPSEPRTRRSVGGLLIDDEVEAACARLAAELYLGSALPGWWQTLDPCVALPPSEGSADADPAERMAQALSARLERLAAGLTPGGHLLLVVDRVFRRDQPALNAAVVRAVHDFLQVKRSLTVVCVWQTSFPPAPSANQDTPWERRVSWPLARRGFNRPEQMAPFRRYLPDTPLSAPVPRLLLRSWLQSVRTVTLSRAQQARWRRLPLEEARSRSLLAALAPSARWELLDGPGPALRPGQLELSRDAAWDERVILTADAPPPRQALSLAWCEPEGGARLPFDPDAFLFDVSPLPEWLSGRHG